MADIDIQPRRRGGVWVWIIALAVLALLVWLVAELFEGPDEAEARAAAAVPAATAAVTGPPVPVLVVDPAVPAPAVAAFVDHVRGGETRMGADHVYTAEAIARMATALRELVEAHRGLDADAHAQADRFYTLAAALVASPDSLHLHADWVRNAAIAAAGVMQGLSAQVQGPVPEMREQVAQVRRAALAIDPARDLLQQKEQVRGFFNQATDAMAMLVNPRP